MNIEINYKSSLYYFKTTIYVQKVAAAYVENVIHL